MVLSHVGDHGRAGGGDVAIRVGREQIAVFGGDEVGAEAHLVHLREAQLAQGGHERPVSQSVNSAGKLGATMAATGRVAGEQLLGVLDAVSTCLAFWLQTVTQLPQPMQRSG